MDLSNFQRKDPHLLYGLVNTELRNNADDLDDLCKIHDIDQSDLIECLLEAGYEYQFEIKQFR